LIKLITQVQLVKLKLIDFSACGSIGIVTDLLKIFSTLYKSICGLLLSVINVSLHYIMIMPRTEEDICI